jgi:hypothetical protein
MKLTIHDMARIANFHKVTGIKYLVLRMLTHNYKTACLKKNFWYSR